MPTREDLGGIVHSYQRYDPARIPPPRPQQVDMVSPAMEHLLEFGELDELSPEELAGAVMLDPEQIRGLGPSIESLRRMLEARKRKILERWDAAGARKRARSAFRDAATRVKPPAKHKEIFHRAVREEQLRLLERLWYAQDDDQSRFGADLVGLVDRLAAVYQLDELATKWAFTGREKLDVEQALEVKEELEEIDRLLAERIDREIAHVPAFNESISTVNGQPHGNILYSWNSGYWWLRKEIRRRLGQTGPDPVDAAVDAKLGVVRDGGFLRVEPASAKAAR